MCVDIAPLSLFQVMEGLFFHLLYNTIQIRDGFPTCEVYYI